MISQREATVAFTASSSFGESCRDSCMVLGLLMIKVLLELLPVPYQGNGFWSLAGLPSTELGQEPPALASDVLSP